VWYYVNASKDLRSKTPHGVEDNHRMSFTVFLGNLPVWVTADDIRGWLSAENLVADAIKVIRNPETQESKGFAFIDAPNTEEMNSIIRRFDRAPLEDRLLRANPAQPPRPKSQGEGRGRPTGPPGSGGYGPPNHASSGPPSYGGQASSGGHAAVSGQGQAGSSAGPASGTGQAPAGQAAGGGSSASSATASSAGGGDLRPPPRRRKGSAKRPPTAGGPQSPFAEELAKAL
jgi:hypothetical protein